MVYERCGIGMKDLGIKSRVIECMKHSTLSWFGYVEKIPGEEFANKVYQSIIEGRSVKGRLSVGWMNSERIFEGEWSVEIGKIGDFPATAASEREFPEEL